MPAMRKNFAKELKTAFDRDLAKSKKSKKRLLLENDRITAGHLERRALDYRAQMEAHIKQMEK